MAAEIGNVTVRGVILLRLDGSDTLHEIGTIEVPVRLDVSRTEVDAVIAAEVGARLAARS